MLKRSIVVLLLCLGCAANAQKFRFENNAWVDSVFNTLTLEEKIAQLIMAAAYSHPDQYNGGELFNYIHKYKIGGVIFFKGSPQRQALMTNDLQRASKVPLMVGIDGEWGLGMRLDSVVNFPRQMSIAAFDNDSLIYAMGKEIAIQCKAMGIHVNFAPVADINNNPNNPVINDRSWGENKLVVARKSLAYLNGMQQNGIIGCVKHFPGHGDTETDSHYDLPLIPYGYNRLDSLELYPFRYLIDSGAMSVMIAHLYIPSIDPKPRQAVSLSPRLVRYKLIDSMGFEGLIFTDALNMKGVTKYDEPGDLEVKALLAGNDVLLFPTNIPKVIEKVKAALDSCLLDSNAVFYSVKKVLAAKHYAGAHMFKPINVKELPDQLISSDALLLRDELTAKQITVVRNYRSELPIKTADGKKRACLAIGDKQMNPFQETMHNYGRFDYYAIDRDASLISFDLLQHILVQENYDEIIISLHNTNRLKSKMYGLTTNGIALVNQLAAQTKVVLVSFGIPYNLQYFNKVNTIVVGYQDLPVNQEKAAMVLTGAIPTYARLPVTVNLDFGYMDGFTLPDTNGKLVYSLPEKLGYRSADFDRIDSIAKYAIRNGAFPGCQVLVAQHGQVLYQKSFGTKTYESKEPVLNSDIYDVASVTKIAATTLAVMRLYDKGKIDPEKPISYYLKDLKKTNKAKITVREVLTHTAGLKSWIPFYKNIQSDSLHHPFCREKSETYPLQLSDTLFLHRNYTDSVWGWIKQSELGERGKYVYSDLGFYLMKRLVEEETDQPLDEYVEEHFYQPLGLAVTGFKPLQHFPASRIAPTEWDKDFRKTLVQGYVHDPGAAMLGGVSGHAGLFSNSADMAVIMQMLLNGGTYAGRSYLTETTVAAFTSKQCTDCRRGFGFDKPEIIPGKASPVSAMASAASFGHSGFTGTLVWADPETALVYIFLSNRVYPSADNNRITEWSVRTNIQDAIYQIIKKQ